MRNKVFGIGFHKTGVTTLRECFQILGFNTCPRPLAYKIRELTATREHLAALQMADRFEAFSDSPWNYRWMYRVLDQVFPKSKFILTRRDEEQWFQSLLRWTEKNDSGNWIDMLVTVGKEFTSENKKQLIESYRGYNREVQQYFAKRRDKLLIMDWGAGDGWKKLCPFLGSTPGIDSTGGEWRVLDRLPHMLRYNAKTDSYVNYTPRPKRRSP